MASYTTNKGNADVLTRYISGATFKVLLVDAAPASEAAAKDLNFVSDVSGDELADASYARQTLASVAVTEDDSGDSAFIDAADPVFTSPTGGENPVGGWIYREVTNDADSVLLAWIETNDDVTTSGNNVTLALPAAGFYQLS